MAPTLSKTQSFTSLCMLAYLSMNIMVNNSKNLLKRYQRYIIQILNNMVIEQKKLKNSRSNNTNIK